MGGVDIMINPINNFNINNSFSVDAKKKLEETQQSDFEKMLEKAVADGDEKKLKDACQKFESIFINMMFTQMKKTVHKTNLFGESQAEEMYDDMLTEKYSEELSKNNGIGLGDIMYKQLSRNFKK